MNRSAIVCAVMDLLKQHSVIGGNMPHDTVRTELEKYFAQLPEERNRQLVVVYANQVNIECPGVTYTSANDEPETARDGQQSDVGVA